VDSTYTGVYSMSMNRKPFCHVERYELLRSCGMDHADAVYRVADERNESDVRVREIIDGYLAGLYIFGMACGRGPAAENDYDYSMEA
jgi:hypothetical protein